MKSDQKIIEHLNKILYNELIAINQYFLHSRMLKDWGFNKHAEHEEEEHREETEHASLLMERILFLEGMPDLQKLGPLFIGKDLYTILECDLKLENQGLSVLREAIHYAEQIKDYVTRSLLCKILESEEEHVDWLEREMGLYDKLGEQNYLQSQV